MKRYTHIRIMFFFLLLIIHYVSCELPSTQVTTLNNLHKVLQNNTNSKWNSSANPCSWIGVSCTANDSSITNLSLSSLSISGANDPSWSSIVCEIQSLQSLDISNNRLTAMPLPFLSCFGDLKVFNFSYNELTGPLPSFENFGSVEVLDLSHNLFDGVIDSQFDGLNKLKSLNLSYNTFTGSVPTKLGDSMLLEELQLSSNSFDGVIPVQITRYRNLSTLDLGVNRLTGMIPSQIGDLSNLQLLLLSVNYLSGNIPNSISMITTLKRFAANQNNFSGGIPQGLTRHLSYLDMSYNKLNGSIPSDLLSQPNLRTVDLTDNALEGTIPSIVSTTLVRLRLGSNRLIGQIPSWSFGNVEPSLTYLEVDHNNLNGMIPPQLRLCRNLSLLDLSSNNLVGFVPPELGDLNKLQVLQLQHNILSGVIPNEISGLQMLQKLNLSWNSLNGSIPHSLSRLNKLTNLELQVNNLSGELPDSFSTMDSLLELQLGSNKLGGFVRSLPTKLQIALNLSDNNFEGSIPTVLQRLQALEVLDLSNNRFSGEFPSFLRQMISLTKIILSNNSLTGFVPQFPSSVTLLTDGNRNLKNITPGPVTPVGNNKKTVSVAIIVASTAAVVALTILVVVALIVSRKFHKVNNEETSSSDQPQIIKINFLTLNVIHRSNLDFNKAMQAVPNSSNIVSRTRFSTYYKAVMPSGTSYFVKKLNWSDKMFQLGSHDLFEQELEILGRLRNSSVMIPLAYALTTDNAYLFYEFNEKGTLADVLHGSLGNGLDWTNRYSIALGVANGLAFLHECPSGSIILLDLSSKVVMLKSLNEPQIGDIELSKVIDPSKSTGNLSAIAGSVGYTPPEYAYTMRVTMPGNVYSFGVILLELLTGKAAVSEGYELAKWVSSKSKEQYNLDQILDSTVRTSPAIRDQMLAVLKVALVCVSVTPVARPKMRSVLRMLLNARN